MKFPAFCILALCFARIQSSLDDFDDDDARELHSSINKESIFKSEFEDFKELQPDEAKAKLRKLIQSIDKNSDGKITKEELKEWTTNSLKNIDQTDAKNHFTDNDVDKDGFITFYEYLKRSYGYEKSELEDLKREDSPEAKGFLKSINDDHEKFDMTDLNKDGKLSLEEYAAFRHPSKYEHMNEFETKIHMEHFDKNNDGFISLEEFAGPSKGPELDAERMHFNHFDKNKDGKLDIQEVREWSSPGYEKTAEEETEHLFDQSDISRDELLTEDEIIEDYETWVSSHATDYGDHLRKIRDEL